MLKTSQLLRDSKMAKASDTTLYNNQWLQLKESPEGYVYSHEIRCHGHIVVVLPYRRIGVDAWEFLVRDEVTPCWNDAPTRSAITGGVESLDVREDAVRELQEEAGYTVTTDQMVFLGKCRGSKSSDTYYHLYAVDVAGLKPGDALGDGSKNDAAPSVWITADALLQLEDAQAITAYGKATRKLGIY